MTKRSFPLSKVYGLLESGPVVLRTTTHNGAANVMAMWCYAHLECRVVYTRLLNRYNFFVLEVLRDRRERMSAVGRRKAAARAARLTDRPGAGWRGNGTGRAAAA